MKEVGHQFICLRTFENVWCCSFTTASLNKNNIQNISGIYYSDSKVKRIYIFTPALIAKSNRCANGYL